MNNFSSQVVMFLLLYLSSATVNVNACHGAYFMIEFDSSPNPNDNVKKRSDSDYSDLQSQSQENRIKEADGVRGCAEYVTRNITIFCLKRSFFKKIENLKT